MVYHQILNVKKEDYSTLIEVWEKSVRATHDFLPDEEINALRPLILNQYFDAVVLKCIKNKDNQIIGFSGLSEETIEMLFIHPSCQGQGIGSALCQHAIKYQNASKVDVNEQNPKAKTFYEKMGFIVFDRSELDGQGKPFPILHMVLRSQGTAKDST